MGLTVVTDSLSITKTAYFIKLFHAYKSNRKYDDINQTKKPFQIENLTKISIASYKMYKTINISTMIKQHLTDKFRYFWFVDSISKIY